MKNKSTFKGKSQSKMNGMEKDKKTPMLDADKKNEQDIENQDHSGEPNSKPNNEEKPTQEDSKKVPESNDPAGYSDEGDKKKPFGTKKRAKESIVLG